MSADSGNVALQPGVDAGVSATAGQGFGKTGVRVMLPSRATARAIEPQHRERRVAGPPAALERHDAAAGGLEAHELHRDALAAAVLHLLVDRRRP